MTGRFDKADPIRAIVTEKVRRKFKTGDGVYAPEAVFDRLRAAQPFNEALEMAVAGGAHGEPGLAGLFFMTGAVCADAKIRADMGLEAAPRCSREGVKNPSAQAAYRELVEFVRQNVTQAMTDAFPDIKIPRTVADRMRLEGYGVHQEPTRLDLYVPARANFRRIPSGRMVRQKATLTLTPNWPVILELWNAEHPKRPFASVKAFQTAFSRAAHEVGVPKVDDPDLRPLWEYLKGLDGAEVKK